MATIQVLDFPAIVPDTTEWGIVTNTQMFTSPLSGDTQTVSMPGARWIASLTFTNLTQSNARDLMAFLLRLKGPAGRFRLYDHSQIRPRGTAIPVGASGTVDGSDQTGSTINTKGWSPNQTTLFLPGDYFQIRDELKMVVQTASSNGSGLSPITFEPPIRNSPSDNTNITILKPTCVMMLADDEQITWSNAESILLSGITINCIEVFFNG